MMVSDPAARAPMNEDTILAVEDLSVTLDAIQVLRNVSFTVKQGEALAVIGPNGAGKTVLFRVLLGLLPHQGLVRWRPNTRIGYVPQRFAVERSAPITALEFCLLKSPNFWRPPAAFLRQLHDEIARMGLDQSILQKNLGELSGGQTQRLLIAWAMLQQPGVLLLDEPTAGVDAGFEDTIYSLIRRVQTERGTTILLISHDLSVIYRYAQKVLCINKSIVCQGLPVEALNPAALAALYGDTGYYRHDPDMKH
jgi:ABC-type Mn2+/Zn2+ transport system ATPase subunit